MNIAQEIKFEAARQGIELQDLAEQIGTYPAVFSRAISGERPMNLKQAEAAARILNVPLSELVRRAELACARGLQSDANEPTGKDLV